MKTLVERFWAKVERRADDECWPWNGYVTPQGYGKMYLSPGRYEWSHRVSWFLANGEEPPEGMHVDHVRDRGCVRRDCVNPAHLEVVSPRENTLRGQSPTVVLHRAGVCSRGHPRSEFVLRKHNGRVVYCKACRREKRAEAKVGA